MCVIFYHVVHGTGMDTAEYHDVVVANRRKHGFREVEADVEGFDPLWIARDEDDTIGHIATLATVVDGQGLDTDDVVAEADRFREVLDDVVDLRSSSTTPIGYVVFTVDDPDDRLVDAALSYTVAKQRTNVFPVVYDCETETLHKHEVPRLKGRGLYRRQSEDVARLFEA